MLAGAAPMGLGSIPYLGRESLIKPIEGDNKIAKCAGLCLGLLLIVDTAIFG